MTFENKRRTINNKLSLAQTYYLLFIPYFGNSKRGAEL